MTALSSTTALNVCANDDSLARPARDAEPATLVRIAKDASADASASAARARYALWFSSLSVENHEKEAKGNAKQCKCTQR